MMIRRILLICLLTAGLLAGAADALAAKRLGGGNNLGRQRAMPAQTTPAPASAAAAQPGVSSGTLPQALPQPVPNLQPRPRSSWMGPLAGFAGGALLGGLLFGHGGFGGFGGGGILLPLLLIGLFIFLLRRFLSGASPSRSVAGATSASSVFGLPIPERPVEGTVIPFGQAAPAGALQVLQGGAAASAATNTTPGSTAGLPAAAIATPAVPPGFDVPAFLREARIAFVRLQAANDRGDLADLREFTAPQMYAALAMEIQERHGVPQRNEVLSLDAHLVDFEMAQGEALASVLFEGEISEDQAPPAPFREIWHVRKLIDDPGATWLLAGIQQPK